MACAGWSGTPPSRIPHPGIIPSLCLCRTGMPWLIEDPTAKDPLTQAEIDYINT